MEDLIDIIVDNYVLILIVVGVIVMIIVGYIADKTDFWHKKKTDKIEDEKPKEENIDIDSLKKKKIGDMFPNANNEDLSVPLNNDLNDLNAPFGDTISSSKLNESTNNVLNEDLNAPFGDQNGISTVFSSSLSEVSKPDTNIINEPEPVVNKNEMMFAAPPSLSDAKPTTNEDNNIYNFEQATSTNANEDILNENLNVPFGDQAPVENTLENNTNIVEEIIEPDEGLNSPFNDVTPVEDTSLQEELSIFENPISVDTTNSKQNDVQTDSDEVIVKQTIPEENTRSKYLEPLVPEFITEDLVKEEQNDIVIEPDETNNSESDEDIWKF